MLRALSGKLIPVPLCGMPEGVDNNLTLSSSQRDLDDFSEERFQELYSLLNTIAGDDGLDLIVVDPLAQFGGGDFEKDNGEASKLMRQFQRLTSVKSKPPVLLVHHFVLNYSHLNLNLTFCHLFRICRRNHLQQKNVQFVLKYLLVFLLILHH